MSDFLYEPRTRVTQFPERDFPVKFHLRDQPALHHYRMYVRQQVQLESEPCKAIVFLEGDRVRHFEELV